MDQQKRRMFFGAAAAGGAALAAMATASTANAAGLSSFLTVGAGGDFPDLASALTSITDNTESNPYLLKLLPGLHVIPPGGLALKPYVNIDGCGQTATEIVTGGYDVLTAASSCKISNLTISGDFTSLASAGGAVIAPSGVAVLTDFKMDSVDLYVTGGYMAAVSIPYGNTCFFQNVNVYTTSIGLELGGKCYLDGIRIFMSGLATGTPYYGIHVPAAARIYLSGAKIGTGYGETTRAGFGAGLEVESDPTADVIGIYIPANNPTIPRLEIHDLNAYARNDSVTDPALRINCVRADGGWVRMFGGLQQAETAPNITIGKTLFTSGSGRIEALGNRFTGQGGNIWGAPYVGLSTLTVANHNLKLDTAQCGVHLCDASGGPFTLKLPGQSLTSLAGLSFTFVKTDTSANVVTIRAGSDTLATISGATSKLLNAPYQTLKVISTPAMWIML